MRGVYIVAVVAKAGCIALFSRNARQKRDDDRAYFLTDIGQLLRKFCLHCGEMRARILWVFINQRFQDWRYGSIVSFSLDGR